MSGLELFGIFFSALLINNILLIRFLALCSFFGVSTGIENSIGMSSAVIFVMTISSAISWGLYNFVLVPFQLEFLRTASFILVIAALVQLEEIYLKKMIPNLYRSMGIYLPLITTNCAILAVAFLAIDYRYSFIASMAYSVGVSAGYSLAIILFAYIRERMALAPIPKWFQGYPIAFVTAALMSLAFLGFTGMFGL
ncbi:electron transport complex subunit RsxA [candidate division WOR-1 bacterium RIFOXYA12_FULL_43_27]|uniref:Ion-translocating oxidoreductase complex subunit A n=1 Tax=candidate division WOR-1 bacterium RIFOXYC2_FULL_46_14 TaxID=1802587 RepID=A0A1F4U4Q8_UNCSA|nr:MAG: electron transport complex subunit RsxA [candidate division WOR-1 bacterium RIFOXYA12_FULL_43_27]OGC20744.1 MAG: electron transport complex subunit RsxA [candidate division WOR-1 bacterium RIFOXYB2_FULL_46_45]OGC31519.1 MAG: electron transport complex subunit RsxA [candidate division WOR-1 bacterium RIFOXYA2_FULL_46_56]OGC39926.1 MAG: electron transport complex subunit RsxA [candidate division WOR-1 bacterium RIFOXYC2_FULL_46_14]